MPRHLLADCASKLNKDCHIRQSYFRKIIFLYWFCSTPECCWYPDGLWSMWPLGAQYSFCMEQTILYMTTRLTFYENGCVAQWLNVWSSLWRDCVMHIGGSEFDPHLGLPFLHEHVWTVFKTPFKHWLNCCLISVQIQTKIYGKACRLSAYCLTCLIEQNITLVVFLVATLIV